MGTFISTLHYFFLGKKKTKDVSSSSLDDCLACRLSLARLERTKEEEALTHLSTERERERERDSTHEYMESGSNQTIHVDATSSINNNNQKENLAGRETNSSTSTGGGGASVATGSLLKSGVPLPKPIVPGSIGGKKVGSKSKNNVELHSNSNNNGSSGDAATNGEHHSQHKKKKV